MPQTGKHSNSGQPRNPASSAGGLATSLDSRSDITPHILVHGNTTLLQLGGFGKWFCFQCGQGLIFAFALSATLSFVIDTEVCTPYPGVTLLDGPNDCRCTSPFSLGAWITALSRFAILDYALVHSLVVLIGRRLAQPPTSGSPRFPAHTIAYFRVGSPGHQSLSHNSYGLNFCQIVVLLILAFCCCVIGEAYMGQAVISFLICSVVLPLYLFLVFRRNKSTRDSNANNLKWNYIRTGKNSRKRHLAPSAVAPTSANKPEQSSCAQNQQLSTASLFAALKPLLLWFLVAQIMLALYAVISEIYIEQRAKEIDQMQNSSLPSQQFAINEEITLSAPESVSNFNSTATEISKTSREMLSTSSSSAKYLYLLYPVVGALTDVGTQLSLLSFRESENLPLLDAFILGLGNAVIVESNNITSMVMTLDDGVYNFALTIMLIYGLDLIKRLRILRTFKDTIFTCCKKEESPGNCKTSSIQEGPTTASGGLLKPHCSHCSSVNDVPQNQQSGPISFVKTKWQKRKFFYSHNHRIVARVIEDARLFGVYVPWIAITAQTLLQGSVSGMTSQNCRSSPLLPRVDLVSNGKLWVLGFGLGLRLLIDGIHVLFVYLNYFNLKIYLPIQHLAGAGAFEPQPKFSESRSSSGQRTTTTSSTYRSTVAQENESTPSTYALSNEIQCLRCGNKCADSNNPAESFASTSRMHPAIAPVETSRCYTHTYLTAGSEMSGELCTLYSRPEYGCQPSSAACGGSQGAQKLTSARSISRPEVKSRLEGDPFLRNKQRNESWLLFSTSACLYFASVYIYEYLAAVRGDLRN